MRGVRVVEFGQYIPGPLLGVLLAEQGATSSRWSGPGGDPAYSDPAFSTWNRSKRPVELDLKMPDGLKQAHEMANRADVAEENNRKGSLARLGLGYE